MGSEPLGLAAGVPASVGVPVSLPGHEHIHAVHSTAGFWALLAAGSGTLIAYLLYGARIVEPAEIKNTKSLLAQPTEIIGPFQILSLGTRTGKHVVRRAAGLSSGPEHIITIRVRWEDGRMESKAERLVDILRLTGQKAAQVMLHSAKTKE